MGCPLLILAVDHKPLTKILNDRALESIHNPRLLRLKERTLMYNFNIIHVPGNSATMTIADAASRHPVDSGQPQMPDDDDQVTVASAAQRANEIDSITWNIIDERAAFDQECSSLIRQIQEGFPDSRNQLPHHLRTYWPMRDELYVIGNVPFKDHKMLIPSALRKDVLIGLHAAHQGVNGMLANARERFFWPGLDAAIRLTRSQCKQCNEQAPSQPAEPQMVSPPPEMPFEQVVMDLCHLAGHDYLVYADRYSGWIEAEKLSSTAFPHVRRALLGWFMSYGVPTEISSDGGPPFNSSEYTALLKDWDIRRRLSSAHYPPKQWES